MQAARYNNDCGLLFCAQDLRLTVYLANIIFLGYYRHITSALNNENMQRSHCCALLKLLSPHGLVGDYCYFTLRYLSLQMCLLYVITKLNKVVI